MRTTLTLDDDVARLVADATHREKRSTKAVVNDALRRALGTRESGPYRAPVVDSALAPGVDAARLNQMADELEDEATIGNLDT